ncbi:MAG: flagellar basal body rod protein FlgB [Pseudomonadota bacterium]
MGVVMSLQNFSIFEALRTKLHWHQTRQTMLAQNVANADTPRYRAQDLAPLDFSEKLAAVRARDVTTRMTHTSHIEGVAPSIAGTFKTERSGGFEITPEGNEVVLEEQMMKVTSNQMDYQLASTLYSRSLGLLKTALSRRG